MTATSVRMTAGIALFVATCLAAGFAVKAQSPGAQSQKHTSSSSSVEEQRQEMWNSPAMLRARAWAMDYFQHSDKVTPEQAKQYMAELKQLPPRQMKLWLMHYEHQQEVHSQKKGAVGVAHRAAAAHASASMQQQQQWFDRVRRAQLAQAKAANRQTRQDYANVERGESEAALHEQGQLNAEAADARQMQSDKHLDLDNPYPYYGPGYGPGFGFGFGFGGYGGIHYHYHMYP